MQYQEGRIEAEKSTPPGEAPKNPGLDPAAEPDRPHFSLERLLEARKRTWEAVHALAATIEPGMSEGEAVRCGRSILAKAGARKFWHPVIVRFGASTVLGFQEPMHKERRLGEHDLFFIDIGPVFAGHEGDCGKTFVVGDSPATAAYRRCAEDSQLLWQHLADLWRAHTLSGTALLTAAQIWAAERGWELAPEYVQGHGLADFPHPSGGTLYRQATPPKAHRWVLEVQLRSLDGRFGAFYEDLLA